MNGVPSVDLDGFDQELKPTLVEVSSEALGGVVLSCSDEFFEPACNLIKTSPSESRKGQFGPNGARYDGWESRRHNPAFDWAIIKLGPAQSHLSYVDIDTTHFNGNECPQSQVFGLKTNTAGEKTLRPKDARWEELLPVVELGPNSRHIFQLNIKAQEQTWDALMVRMIPDGGMARFRAFGRPVAPALLSSLPLPSVEPIDLLSALYGARVVACSNANFSPPENLLRPERGVDMSGGWESARTQEGRGKYGPQGNLRGQERKEWVIVKMATTGALRYAEVDTAFHPGNYPKACTLEAAYCDGDLPSETTEWAMVIASKPLGPHRQHWLDLERNVPRDKVFSHIRFSTYPDGGLKRLRVYGHPISPESAAATAASLSGPPTIPCLPLTVEAFKPYGDVIQGFSLPTSAPKGIDATMANQNTAFKFHRLAKVAETYPKGMLKRMGLSIGLARGLPHHDVSQGAKITVKTLERHRHTTQAFIPLGKDVSPGTRQLKSGGAYVVIAVLNGKDDKPDMNTARAFLATAAQGVSFHEGIWHHSLLTVDGPLDYACVEAQVGDPGLILDCEMHTPEQPYAYLQVPAYTAKDPKEAPRIAATLGLPEEHHHSTLETLSHLLPSIPPAIDHLAHPTHGLVHPTWITDEAFAPFGHLIKAHPDPDTRPGAIETQGSLVTGKAEKYVRLAPILSSYPEGEGAVTGIGVYRATKKIGLDRGKVFDVRLMERHPFTTQAFIPMGKGEWTGKGEPALPPKGTFLVVVAQNTPEGRPDSKTLKSFLMPSSCGLSYSPGVWHHPVLILDSTLDLACVETQLHTSLRETDVRDCELLEWEGEEVFGRIAVPL